MVTQLRSWSQIIVSTITTNGIQIFTTLIRMQLVEAYLQLAASWLFIEQAQKIFELVERRVVNELGRYLCMYMKLNVSCSGASPNSLWTEKNPWIYSFSFSFPTCILKTSLRWVDSRRIDAWVRNYERRQPKFTLELQKRAYEAHNLSQCEARRASFCLGQD